MAIYFTADQHFYHGNVINFCNRPFDSVEEMNEGLITHFNRWVGKKDTTYHLGDFAWRNSLMTYVKLFERLNGRHFLVPGNHDKKNLDEQSYLGDNVEVLPLMVDLKLEGHHLLLSHYPIESFPKNRINLHGHSHGKAPALKRRADVGVDCWGMRPVSLEGAVEWALL